MPIGRNITTPRHSKTLSWELYSVSVQKYSPLSIFPLVQVYFRMILTLCLFKLTFLIFIRMFDKTDIQWSSEVSHTNLHKKIFQKIVKRVLMAKKKKLPHYVVGLLY